jgi:hypothetical protein
MKFADEVADEQTGVTEEVSIVRLRRERDSAKKEVLRLTQAMDEANRIIHAIEQVNTSEIEPPRWLSPAKPRASAATLVAMLSDTHFDEVVNPDEMEGLNAYNRTIAKLRLERWAKNVVKMARHYLAGMKYDGLVLVLGGDIFSGDIHEELKDTNEATMLESCLYWSEQIAGAVGLLAEEFGRVQVVSVVGNHGRMSRKPRMKQRVVTNFDWLLAKMVERYFADDRRVSFVVPTSPDAWIQIYGHGHLITHGDQVHGGGGIGGIYPPIMRMRAKKEHKYLQTGQNFRTLWLGHWHSYLSTPHLIINGSLKGWDEFAAIMGFGFEPPQQALAIVTPERNITVQAPIFCQDRKREGW